MSVCSLNKIHLTKGKSGFFFVNASKKSKMCKIQTRGKPEKFRSEIWYFLMVVLIVGELLKVNIHWIWKLTGIELFLSGTSSLGEQFKNRFTQLYKVFTINFFPSELPAVLQNYFGN